MNRRRRAIPATLVTLAALWSAPAAAQTHDAPAARPADASPRAPLGELGRRIASAPAGSTIVVEPGVYREHLTIDRPLALVGRPGAVIDGGGSGDIIEITAPDVTVRGLTVRNTGIDLDKENAAVRVLAPRATLESLVLEDVLFGIDLREAPDSTLRGNTVGGKRLDIARRGDGLRLWRSDRCLVEGNTIHDGRDAIIWYSTGVTVRDNHGRDCRYGLHLMFSDSVTIESNRFENNSVGVYLMYSTGVEVRGNRLTGNRGPSGYGLGLKETDRFTVRDNLIAANRAGIYIDGSPFTASIPGTFTRNTVACNDVGVVFLPSARGNELYENNFIDNIDQIAVAGRGDLSANSFFKGERGNFWSDYTGYDLNHDGVGDFVHESQTLFENLMDRNPSLRLMLFSPAQQAIEFVGRAVPAIRPEAKFTDEVPLMRPVEIAVSAPDAPAGAPAQAIGAALLLIVGGGLVGLARAGRSATGGVA